MVTQYMRAGYVPQCGCRKLEALSYVAFVNHVEQARWAEDECHIEINIGDSDVEMWIPSQYCWENELLLKEVGA